MLTFATFEVNFLIYPAFITFLVMLLPIPFISTVVAKFIAKLETIRVGGVSVLFVIACGGVLLFSYSLKDYNDHYGGDVGKDGKPFPDFGHRDFSRHMSRKWRMERNMYIHAILAILYSALLKMARLTLESDALVTKAKELDKVIGTPAEAVVEKKKAEKEAAAAGGIESPKKETKLY